MAEGRPRKEIDKKEFERLLSIGCDKSEIVAWFNLKQDISGRTLDRWIKREYHCTFVELSTKRHSIVKMRVRKGIMEMVGKNAAVTIFAAKNVLGWTDKMEQTLNTDDGSIKQIDVRFIKDKVMEEGRIKDGDKNAD